MRPITSRWSSSLSPVRGKPPTPSSLQPAVSSQSHPTAMMPMTTPPMLCNLGKSYPNAAFQHSFSDQCLSKISRDFQPNTSLQRAQNEPDCCSFRETLVAMMNKLTGDLRNTQQTQLPQQELHADIGQGGQPPMPGTPSLPAPNACSSLPAARTSSPLDHAPSMALIPSSASLAVPAVLLMRRCPHCIPSQVYIYPHSPSPGQQLYLCSQNGAHNKEVI